METATVTALTATWFNLITQQPGTIEQWHDSLPENAIVILGEEHYTPPVQELEAKILDALRPGVAAWEFLDFQDQPLIDDALARLRQGELQPDAFFAAIPSRAQDANNQTYAPIVLSLGRLDARFVGTNVPRAIKNQLRKEGFDSLPETYKPPLFSMGSERYKQRFAALMEGHVTPERISEYYLAQCYTDSVMAWKLAEAAHALPANRRAVMIVGSFHQEYDLGLVAQLRALTQRPVVTVRLTAREIPTPTDPIDGRVADWIAQVGTN